MTKPVTLKFTGSEDVTLTADVQGDPSAPPVILLHGGGQTRHAWGEAARRFAQEGFYAITMDLRGHGDSGWSPDGIYEIEHHVADLHCLLQQLPGAENPDVPLPVLVGASMGGVTSLLAVGGSSEAIARGLVLVDIVPKINVEGAQRIRAFMSANPEGFASIEEAADVVSSFLPHRPRPKDVSGLQKNLRRRDDGRYYWHWDPRMMDQTRLFNADAVRQKMLAAARAVRIPALLVKGGASEIVDEEGVNEFQQVIPHSQVVDVKDAAHMVAGDKNSAFNDAVLEFLQGLPEGGGRQ